MSVPSFCVQPARIGGLCLLLGACEPSPATTKDVPAALASAPVRSAIPVQVYVVTPRPLQVTVTATGTLLANESVEVVSELNRRLVEIHAKEGETVKRGALLYELDSSDLRAELAILDVEIEQARREVERQTALLRELITTLAEQESAKSRLDELQARRSSLLVTFDKTRLRAPFSGTLGLRRVSKGAWLSPSTVITTLEDVSSLKVDFTLPERYSPEVAIGRVFTVSVAGHSAPVEGEIVAIESRVSASSRSLVVRGVLRDSNGLRPGNFAKIELPLQLKETLSVPAVAVLSNADGRSVYVVDENDVAHAVNVEVGQRDAQFLEVTSGLASGARVVTTNLLRLREGELVRVVPEADR